MVGRKKDDKDVVREALKKHKIIKKASKTSIPNKNSSAKKLPNHNTDSQNESNQNNPDLPHDFYGNQLIEKTLNLDEELEKFQKEIDDLPESSKTDQALVESLEDDNKQLIVSTIDRDIQRWQNLNSLDHKICQTVEKNKNNQKLVVGASEEESSDAEQSAEIGDGVIYVKKSIF